MAMTEEIARNITATGRNPVFRPGAPVRPLDTLLAAAGLSSLSEHERRIAAEVATITVALCICLADSAWEGVTYSPGTSDDGARAVVEALTEKLPAEIFMP